MTWAEAHKAEAFVGRLRDEAAEGAKHFANLPHHAGSTKTALALTILAYTAGKRDGLKPRATELAAINKDLSWTKHELAKRDLEQEDVVKKLRLDLRWAKIQLAKKDEKLQALKEELDVERKSRQQMTENESMSADGFNGTAKVDELQKHTVATDNDDMRSLEEQYENFSRTSTPDGHSSSENFEAKVGALQETIDLIEANFKKTCSQLQTQLAQAERQVHRMQERLERQAIDHHVQLVQAQQRTAECQAETHLITWEKKKILEEKEKLAKSHHVQLVNTQHMTAKSQAENHRLIWEKQMLSAEVDKQIAQLKPVQQCQNGCLPDHQEPLEYRVKFLIQEWQQKLRRPQNENGASTKSADSSQAIDVPSIHIQSIQKLEEKLAVIEFKANKNEQDLKKKVQELENKLTQLGPLGRFLEDRDFSDEKRVHLSWGDMTYAVRAAAVGLSPQIRRTLGHGYSTYIVEDALRHGSKDLVSFAHDSPGRFALRFTFFEAVESIVDNILWEAQKFPYVRKTLNEDSANVKTALTKHAFK